MFTPKQYVDMIMEPRELERLIDKALRNGLLTVCLGQYRSEVAINAVLALYESAGWKLWLNRSDNNTLTFEAPQKAPTK